MASTESGGCGSCRIEASSHRVSRSNSRRQVPSSGVSGLAAESVAERSARAQSRGACFCTSDPPHNKHRPQGFQRLRSCPCSSCVGSLKKPASFRLPVPPRAAGLVGARGPAGFLPVAYRGPARARRPVHPGHSFRCRARAIQPQGAEHFQPPSLAEIEQLAHLGREHSGSKTPSRVGDKGACVLSAFSRHLAATMAAVIWPSSVGFAHGCGPLLNDGCRGVRGWLMV